MEQITKHFAWGKRSDKIQVIVEINYHDGLWHYNQSIWKSKHDHNQTKSGDSHKYFDQCRVKMADEVGKILESGQTNFHPDMIENVHSLNEMTKKIVKFNSGNKMLLRCILEIRLLVFQLMVTGFISVTR